jgi:two-component system osmolarity sensor histidine kinase EnvZ
MAQDLRETEIDRELMLAGLSHDLRTPLTRMRLEIELSSASEATLQYIDQDLTQIDQSISKLMEYARAARPQSHTDLDVSALLECITMREHKQLQSIGGTLHVSIAPQVHMHIESLSLQRIVANLLENAQRYGCGLDQPPDLTVTLTQDHKDVWLEVSDRGPGIAQTDIARMMRPFSRGDMARTGGAGTGLGLAIVERLTHQAGGSLSLIPRAGGGLTATVRLPRVKLHARE